jgi:two-component system, OmpR family, sensor histidine kinase VicK
MLNREMTPERRKDLLGSIHRHCQSMVSILNELLDLARIESRRGQDFQFEQVDMAEVVQSVLADFKPPAGRQPPHRSASPGPMPVRADAHKLQQAVLNILSNAYKYSPDGGEVAVGFISQADEQGRTRHGVRIEDHGVGLSDEDQARLGERFFRVDKSGNIPGTGLGVSIVKELMELMGGRMQVRSALGQGTTVTLWL